MIKRKINNNIKKPFRRYLRFVLPVLVFIFGLVFFFGCCWLRNHGTVVFPKKDVEVSVREDVFYSQKDARWAEEKLGNSRFAMRGSGCLVCCIAASLQLQGREEEDPGRLNQMLSHEGGYDEEGNLQWDKLSQIDGRIAVERCKTVNVADIQESLASGRFPIVRVRINGVGSVHYVLIVGAKDGEYWCMDPLSESGKAVPLSAFGNRVYAVRYVDFVQ